MSIDVATLQLNVDSTSVKAGKQDLADFQAQAALTEGAVKESNAKVSQSFSQIQQGARDTATAYRDSSNVYLQTTKQQAAQEEADRALTQRSTIAMYRGMFDQIDARAKESAAAQAAADKEAALAAKTTAAERIAAIGEVEAAADLTRRRQNAAILSQAKQSGYSTSSAAVFDPIQGPLTQADTASMAAKQEALTIQRQLATDTANYNNVLQGVIRSEEDVTKVQEGLNRLQLAGKITAEEYAIAQTAVGNAHFIVGSSAKAVGVEVEKAATKFTMNARFMGEASTVLSDLVTGQWGRMRRSIAAMANSSGLIQSVFTPMGFAIAGATVALVAFGAEVLSVIHTEAGFEQALTRSGNAAGKTSDQLHQAALGLASYSVNVDKVQQIQQGLISTGAVTASTFDLQTKAAVAFGKFTGDSVKSIVSVFDDLAKNPVQTLDKLNQLYNISTPAITAQVTEMQRAGDVTGATALVYQTLLDTLGKTGQVVVEQGDWLDHLVNKWHNGVAAMRADIQTLVAPGDNDKFKAQLKAYTDDLNMYNKNGGPDSYYRSTEFIDKLNKERDALVAFQNQIKDKQTATANQGQTDEDNKAEQAAQARYNAEFLNLDKTAEKKQKLIDLQNIYEGLFSHNSKGDNAQLADVTRTVGADGKDVFSGGQYDKDVANINRRYKDPKVKKDPEVNAYDSFSSKVDGLDNKTLNDESDKAITKYEQGIAKLSEWLNTYMEKNGDATKGAALFNKGQKDLAETLKKNQKDEQESTDAFALGYAKKHEALQRSIDDQVNAIGMGAKEAQRAKEITQQYREQADALAALGLEREKGKNGQPGGISESQYQADVKTVNETADANVKSIQGGFIRIDAAQSNWLKGAKTSLSDWADAGRNSAGLMQTFTTSALDGMNNSLASFVTTGKLNFKSLVTSILSDLAKMELRILESKILQGIIGAFAGGASYGGGSGAASGTGSFSGFGSSGTQTVSYNAAGGVYDSPSLSAYSGQVVSSPTTFAFANGAGLMGEAGPEAIMPLSRGADGKLGVMAANGGSGGNNITVSTTVVIEKNGQAKSDTATTGDDKNQVGKQIGDMVKGVVVDTVTRMTLPGGFLWKQGVGNN